MKIAFTGKMRSGKDTVASYVIAKYGFKRFAFGDSLKKYAKELFAPRYNDDQKPRELLQSFGQKMREIEPDIWIRLTLEQVGESEDVLITDLRQPNEYQKLKELGYLIIRINSNDHKRIQRMIDSNDDVTVHDIAHETELSIDKFVVDYEIYNDGLLDDTYKQIDEILQKMKE